MLSKGDPRLTAATDYGVALRYVRFGKVLGGEPPEIVLQQLDQLLRLHATGGSFGFVFRLRADAGDLVDLFEDLCFAGFMERLRDREGRPC